ncbi:TolC family protein [Neisseriaceae bacterium B1]
MKNIKAKKNIYFLSYSLFSLMSSPITYAFNLQEAWIAAQQNSADYHAAFHQKNVIKEQQQQAKSAFFPHLSGNINYQRQPHSATAIKQNQGWNLQLSQTLFDASKIAQYRQSRYNSKAAEQRYDASKENLLHNVAENYFNLLLSKETIAAYAAEKAAYEQQIRQAQALFNKGAATALDIHEAKAGYDNALAQEIAAISKKQILENQLNDYTGLDSKQIEPIDISNLTEDYLPKIKKHSLDEWQRIALENNHEYAAQKYAVSSSDEAFKVAKHKRLPTVTAQIDYQNNQFVSESQNGNYKAYGKEMNTNIQLRVSLPLFTGGELRSKIREAASQYEVASAQLTAMERQIKLAVRQAYTESNAAHYQILAQERVLKSSHLKFKSTQTGQQYGIRNRLEVIQARQAITQAEQKLAEAKYKFLMAYLTLIKESGLGLEGNLNK